MIWPSHDAIMGKEHDKNQAQDNHHPGKPLQIVKELTTPKSLPKIHAK